MAVSRRRVKSPVREMNIHYGEDVIPKPVFKPPGNKPPTGNNLERIRLDLTEYGYVDRRVSGIEERRSVPDRRKVSVGETVSPIKNKPAFKVTQTEFEGMKNPPKKWRTEGGHVILKERRRSGDRRK
jgi:hypothetical protein